jgi:hypothetical protein
MAGIIILCPWLRIFQGGGIALIHPLAKPCAIKAYKGMRKTKCSLFWK